MKDKNAVLTSSISYLEIREMLWLLDRFPKNEEKQEVPQDQKVVPQEEKQKSEANSTANKETKKTTKKDEKPKEPKRRPEKKRPNEVRTSPTKAKNKTNSKKVKPYKQSIEQREYEIKKLSLDKLISDLPYARVLNQVSATRSYNSETILNISQTVSKTAQTKQLFPVLEPKVERYGTLVILEEVDSDTMIVWEGLGERIQSIISQYVSHLQVSHHFISSNRPLNVSQLDINIGFPEDILVLIVSDGLSEFFRKRLHSYLQQLPVGCKIAWYHPWGKEYWNLTAENRMSYVPPKNFERGKDISLFLLGPDIEQFSFMSDFAHQKLISPQYFRKLETPTEPRKLRRRRIQNVENENNKENDAAKKEEAEKRQAQRIYVQVQNFAAPQVMDLLSFMAALPFGSMDFHTLLYLCDYLGVEEPKHVYLAQLLCFGVLKKDEKRSFVQKSNGEKDKDQRHHVFTFVNKYIKEKFITQISRRKYEAIINHLINPPRDKDERKRWEQQQTHWSSLGIPIHRMRQVAKGEIPSGIEKEIELKGPDFEQLKQTALHMNWDDGFQLLEDISRTGIDEIDGKTSSEDTAQDSLPKKSKNKPLYQILAPYFWKWCFPYLYRSSNLGHALRQAVWGLLSISNERIIDKESNTFLSPSSGVIFQYDGTYNPYSKEIYDVSRIKIVSKKDKTLPSFIWGLLTGNIKFGPVDKNLEEKLNRELSSTYRAGVYFHKYKPEVDYLFQYRDISFQNWSVDFKQNYLKIFCCYMPLLFAFRMCKFFDKNASHLKGVLYHSGNREMKFHPFDRSFGEDDLAKIFSQLHVNNFINDNEDFYINIFSNIDGLIPTEDSEILSKICGREKVQSFLPFSKGRAEQLHQFTKILMKLPQIVKKYPISSPLPFFKKLGDGVHFEKNGAHLYVQNEDSNSKMYLYFEEEARDLEMKFGKSFPKKRLSQFHTFNFCNDWFSDAVQYQKSINSSNYEESDFSTGFRDLYEQLTLLGFEPHIYLWQNKNVQWKEEQLQKNIELFQVLFPEQDPFSIITYNDCPFVDPRLRIQDQNLEANDPRVRMMVFCGVLPPMSVQKSKEIQSKDISRPSQQFLDLIDEPFIQQLGVLHKSFENLRWIMNRVVRTFFFMGDASKNDDEFTDIDISIINAERTNKGFYVPDKNPNEELRASFETSFEESSFYEETSFLHSLDYAFSGVPIERKNLVKSDSIDEEDSSPKETENSSLKIVTFLENIVKEDWLISKHKSVAIGFFYGGLLIASEQFPNSQCLKNVWKHLKESKLPELQSLLPYHECYQSHSLHMLSKIYETNKQQLLKDFYINKVRYQIEDFRSIRNRIAHSSQEKPDVSLFDIYTFLKQQSLLFVQMVLPEELEVSLSLEKSIRATGFEKLKIFVEEMNDVDKYALKLIHLIPPNAPKDILLPKLWIYIHTHYTMKCNIDPDFSDTIEEFIQGYRYPLPHEFLITRQVMTTTSGILDTEEEWDYRYNDNLKKLEQLLLRTSIECYLFFRDFHSMEELVFYLLQYYNCHNSLTFLFHSLSSEYKPQMSSWIAQSIGRLMNDNTPQHTKKWILEQYGLPIVENEKLDLMMILEEFERGEKNLQDIHDLLTGTRILNE